MNKDLIVNEDVKWYPTLNDIKKLIKSGEDEFTVIIKNIEDGAVVDVQVDPIVIIGNIVNNGYSLEKCEPTDDLKREWYLHCKKRDDDSV